MKKKMQHLGTKSNEMEKSITAPCHSNRDLIITTQAKGAKYGLDQTTDTGH